MHLLSASSLIWLIPLFLLLLGANLWVFFRREWEESHYPASYATLYYPLDAPTLRGWRLHADGTVSLDLAWNKTPAQWQLTVDNQPPQTLAGPQPRFALAGPKFDATAKAPLDDFAHRYVLRPLPVGAGPDLAFTITTIDHAFYRHHGMHFPNDIILVKTTIPAGEFKRHPLSHWTDDYGYVGAEALAAADRVVRDEMHITDADDTLTRMTKIIRHLRTKLVAASGVPKDSFRWASPWTIYQEMCAGTGKGWCTQNAQIYTFFANRAGLPTRFVFGATTQHNSIVYNGHSWAESWSHEQNRWVYCDPTISLIAIQDRAGAFLNSADLLHLCDHNTFDRLTAVILKDWNWQKLSVTAAPGAAVTVPLTQVNDLIKIELTQQSILKYRLPPNVEDVRDVYSMLWKSPTFGWTNLVRYLFRPAPAYSKMPTHGARVYRLRQSLFAALVATILLIAAALVVG